MSNKSTSSSSKPNRPKKNDPSCCGVRPKLEERPLLSYFQAVQVTALFKVLANDTRIRLLHEIIRCGEANVTSIAGSLGMKPQAVSNQLQRLSDTGVVAHRREGNSIFYQVVDCCVPVLLDQALCIMEDLRAGKPLVPLENSRRGAGERLPAPIPNRRG